MTALPDTNAAVAEAEARLRSLGAQVEAMEALLARLLQDVVRAEARIERGAAGQLVEANEHLVVAALSSQARAEAALHALRAAPFAATTDALTHLPNRSALLDRFAHASANARRNHTRLALLFVDLDKFKQLNDTHGHGFGDQVLSLAAQRMVGVVREVDTVSRYGGDEFLILLDQLGQAGDVPAVAMKLIAAIAAPLVIDGLAVALNASIGIALYPEDGQDAETLIARADAAMYRSKRQCSGGFAAWATMRPEAPAVPVGNRTEAGRAPMASPGAGPPVQGAGRHA